MATGLGDLDLAAKGLTQRQLDKWRRVFSDARDHCAERGAVEEAAFLNAIACVADDEQWRQREMFDAMERDVLDADDDAEWTPPWE